ncbi:hypothetical protein BDP27DRAFT_1423852 [Rhodocollybia butyracea]|uniref:Rad4-domain-containing protein n=1 Tax=Rhodocollybia butyracea TaxID=206335 RepID=A0A9P5PQW5_9AGAR|nr:hypothetical protein BDP27DRAFT_1423852 [Rhodocollybia butyracea]
MSSPFDDEIELVPLPYGSDGGEENSDDEMDWEEVLVSEQASQEPLMKIVLRPDNDEPAKKKSNAMSHAERMLRIDCHKIHTILLLSSARIRNKWLNDELLHARLLSLTPLPLQNAFAMIHSSRIPEAPLRGRMFENATLRLVEWWSQSFFEVAAEGHMRNITFDVMKQSLGKYVPGFTEQFEAAVAPPETMDNHRDRYKLKYKTNGKGKEKEKEKTSSADPLIDATDLDLLEDLLDNSIELIKSPKSLMKHALMQSGSRDTSAQLFTALCRALAIPARLVVSLQSVPWKAAVGREVKRYPKKANDAMGKGKEAEIAFVESPNDSDPLASRDSLFSTAGEGRRLNGTPVEKSEKAKGKERARQPVKLRKSKSKGNVLGSASDSKPKLKKFQHDDPRFTPPIYWTEVFSKADSRWIPVDPIRGYVNKRHAFDPSPTSTNSASSRDNRLVYVLAFEEDGYARDVTRRYAREYSAKVAKVQGGSAAFNAGARARVQWWEGVVGLVTRPFRLHRDDIEDDELETAQMMEGMPNSITGFKDHPLYVLPRHLKQNEAIYPPPAPPAASNLSSGSSTPTSASTWFGRSGRDPSYTHELGKFRGESVYPRSSVISLKTPENWLRSEGRSVKEGVVPMKYVKVRASTIGKRREVEILKEGMKETQSQSTGVSGEGVIGIHVDELDGGAGGAGAVGEIMQGLYARNQTEQYVPDPVVDGIVPKNQFGNIDLYVKTMLPQGAVHIPFKGIAKIARRLQIDFAEAVIGFEFRKRKATPVLEGIVVATENEEVILEAFWESEREASEKARRKKEERVLKQWTRLVHGLRIRQRLQAQYADRRGEESANGSTTIEASGKNSNAILNTSNKGDEDNIVEEDTSDKHIHFGAGFLVEAGDVIQPFRLPQFPKLDDDLVGYSRTSTRRGGDAYHSTMGAEVGAGLDHNGALPIPDFETYDINMEVDDSTTIAGTSTRLTVPKTMQELAHAYDVASKSGDQDLRPVSLEVTAFITSSALDHPVPTSTKGTMKNKKQAPSHRKSTRSTKATSAPKRKRPDSDNLSETRNDSCEEVGGGEEFTSRNKRIRRGKGEETPPSTRVLRPRVSKTPNADMDE